MWIEDFSFKECLGSKVDLRRWLTSNTLPLDLNSTFNLKFLKEFISNYAQPGQTWGVFKHFKNEPNIDFKDLSELGLNFVFPKVEPQIESSAEFKDKIVFYKTQNFKKSALGIFEPQDGEVVHRDQISGLFIPGLAFDVRGTRLGRGRGHYDLFLKDFTGIKVGLTWSQFFLQTSIPKDSWDVSMDFILTEKFLYQPLFEHKED